MQLTLDNSKWGKVIQSLVDYLNISSKLSITNGASLSLDGDSDVVSLSTKLWRVAYPNDQAQASKEQQDLFASLVSSPSAGLSAANTKLLTCSFLFAATEPQLIDVLAVLLSSHEESKYENVERLKRYVLKVEDNSNNDIYNRLIEPLIEGRKEDKRAKVDDKKKEEKKEEKKDDKKKDDKKKDEKKEEKKDEKKEEKKAGDDNKKEKKEKKDAAGGGGAGGGKAGAASEVPFFSRLDLRVVKVVSASPHPTEAKLLVLQVDDGVAPRGVVSGIAELTSCADIVGRHVLCMMNLKSGDIKGVESNGRLLVATGDNNDKELVFVDGSNVRLGEKVLVEGCENTAHDAVLAPKNLHKLMKGLLADNFTVMYEDLPMRTSAGVIKLTKVQKGIVA